MKKINLRSQYVIDPYEVSVSRDVEAYVRNVQSHLLAEFEDKLAAEVMEAHPPLLSTSKHVEGHIELGIHSAFLVMTEEEFAQHVQGAHQAGYKDGFVAGQQGEKQRIASRIQRVLVEGQ